MWKKELWKNTLPFFPPQRVWKNVKFSPSACGEKTVAAHEKNGVFHINLYYHCYYCLNLFIHIYILSYLQERKEIYAFYL